MGHRPHNINYIDYWLFLDKPISIFSIFVGFSGENIENLSFQRTSATSEDATRAGRSICERWLRNPFQGSMLSKPAKWKSVNLCFEVWPSEGEKSDWTSSSDLSFVTAKVVSKGHILWHILQPEEFSVQSLQQNLCSPPTFVVLVNWCTWGCWWSTSHENMLARRC